MKDTFFKLNDKKRNRIINACIDIFSKYGYDKSTTDKIIEKAGISKGSLYEYTSNKEDLYLFITEYVYNGLYDYINDQINETDIKLPNDILDRFQLIAEISADYYIKNPKSVKYIVNNYKMPNTKLEKKIEKIFQNRFTEIFGNIDTSNIKYSKSKLFEMLTWLLIKTRYDFLEKFSSTKDKAKLKKEHLENWNTYLSMLKKGIYK